MKITMKAQPEGGRVQGTDRWRQSLYTLTPLSGLIGQDQRMQIDQRIGRAAWSKQSSLVPQARELWVS